MFSMTETDLGGDTFLLLSSPVLEDTTHQGGEMLIVGVWG